MLNPDPKPHTCAIPTEQPQPGVHGDRLWQLLQAAPDGILEVGSDGCITLANAAVQQMFGYSHEELIGQAIEMLVPTARRAAHVHHRAPYIKNPRSRPMGPGLNLEAQRKDGTLFPVEISLSPNFSGPGESVIAIVRDVSERTRIEQMLKNSEERLRQAEKLEAIGRLAGGVAHEFNNLLSMILGYSELLLPSLTDEKSVAYVEKITASSRRAASLTRQLLAFGRRQMLIPRVLDLNAVVVESCRISSRLLGKNIETVVLPMLEPAWIKADTAQIDQMIASLAANAHAAMPEGGKFTVAVSKITVDEKNAGEYTHLAMGKYVLLSVSDTGNGMTPEIKSRLFEPFFSTREFGKGAGLGLAAIYGTIIQSGGNVMVHSQPGQGTTFQIFLPNVQEPEVALVGPSNDLSASSILGKETILLVEDQEPLLQLSCEFLERAGYRVLIANRPDKAISIAREFPDKINLLLTDILMPGMDGRELADKLREQRPSLKVLYVSGFVDRAFENSRPPTSDEAFMEKPYGFEDLGRKIRELV